MSEQPECVHWWRLKDSTNDWDTDLVFTPGRCIKCGEEKVFKAKPFMGDWRLGPAT